MEYRGRAYFVEKITFHPLISLAQTSKFILLCVFLSPVIDKNHLITLLFMEII